VLRACAISLVLAATPAAGAASPLGAGTQNAAAALGKLQGWIDGTKDLECRFEQTLVSGALGSGITESGKLYLLRPGRIRWDYDDPDRKTALLLGNRTTLYLPEERQLVQGTLEADQAALPELLAGSARLDEIFEATLAAPSVGSAEVRLRLVPRKRPEGVSEVILSLRPPEHSIEGAEVLDGMGNRTSYRFRGVRRNRGLEPSLFRFEPPAGTAIVEP
jgi:outer membrane lipoprotein carrier protein